MQGANYWIEHLNLTPHPEGGHYSSTFKSDKYFKPLLNKAGKAKRCSSLIHFLLKKGDCSHFHRLNSDEIWIFQKGGPLTLWMINKEGQLTQEFLGDCPENDEHLQVFIPANTWFAARLNEGTDFSLMSCLVSPGFEWEDFELAQKKELSRLFPQHKKIIDELCLE